MLSASEAREKQDELYNSLKTAEIDKLLIHIESLINYAIENKVGARSIIVSHYILKDYSIDTIYDVIDKLRNEYNYIVNLEYEEYQFLNLVRRFIFGNKNIKPIIRYMNIKW